MNKQTMLLRSLNSSDEVNVKLLLVGFTSTIAFVYSLLNNPLDNVLLAPCSMNKME